MSLFRYLLIFFSLTTTLVTYATEPVPVQGELENGLRWTILPLNKQKDRVDVIIRVYAGGIDETPLQSGVAHMVEHMAFRATKDHPEGIMNYLLDFGWLRGRNYNAYTTHDHTTYLYFPPKAFGLEKTLATAAQMLFAAEIKAQELDNERKIILEEWRMRDGVKRRLWQKRINSNRYASRYENRPVIGTEQSIKETPIEQLKHYYQDWYVPNNMQVLLVGDITLQQGEKLIYQYFGKYARRTLPERNKDYYEPKLQKQLKIDRLSDPQNTQSQVTYLYRFNDADSQTQDENGRRERLINDLALRLINQYFRAEKANLPTQIANVTARKQLVGKQTGTFFITANIEKQAHHQAVQYLMLQAQRLKHYPFQTDELEQQKQKLLEQTKNERNANQNYSFEDWTQEMISTLLNDKNYYSPTDIEHFVQQTLPTIRIDEINARIQYWLASEDQIIQYMPPLSVEVADINQEMAANWLEQAKNEAIAFPITNLTKEKLTFPALQLKGNITKETEYPKQNLVHWTLSNGDNVFWLKSPTAGSKTYFLAQSEAGSYGKGLTDWQAKLALQLIGKNAPNDWQFEQLKEWKETLGIPLVMRMPFSYFNVLSTVENDKLPHLLRYYYANQQEIRIKEDFEKTKRELIRHIDLQNHSEESKKSLSWENFIYGHPLNSRPTIEEVEKIEVMALEQQWQKIKQAPATFFLINDLEKENVKEMVLNHLGTLSRKEPLPAKPLLVLEGNAEKVYPYNPENRDNIYLSFFQPHNWSVREEMKAKLLSIMASQKMLHKLRDQTQGVYGAKTTIKLTKETERLHTVITFSAEPKQSRQLIPMAESVLQTLPQSLTATDFERVKKHIIEKNEQALKTAEGYLERLVYAVTYAQDPTYLSEADKLIETIRFDEIKELANKVYSEQNRRLFITSAK